MNTTDHLLVATGRSWPADSLHFAATADQPAAREHRIRRATIACAESRKLLERIDGAANARLLSDIYIPPSRPPQPLARRMELSVNETHLSHRLWSRTAPGGALSVPRHRNAFLFAALLRWGKVRMGKSEVYRRFAVECLEMARKMDSEHDRAILIEMALLWSRLAEYAMQSASRKEDVDPA